MRGQIISTVLTLLFQLHGSVAAPGTAGDVMVYTDRGATGTTTIDAPMSRRSDFWKDFEDGFKEGFGDVMGKLIYFETALT